MSGAEKDRLVAWAAALREAHEHLGAIMESHFRFDERGLLPLLG